MAVRDSGSGYGYPPIFTAAPNYLGNQQILGYDSTPLISAKCWNNFDNENECRQLNVIGQTTSSSSGSNSGDFDANGDQVSTSPVPIGERLDDVENGDSLIRPIVIFESSSTVGNQESFANEIDSTTISISEKPTNEIRNDLNWPQIKWGPKKIDLDPGTVQVGGILSSSYPSSSSNENNNNIYNNNISTKEYGSTSDTNSTTWRPKFNLFVVTKNPLNAITRQPSLATTETNIQANRPKCVDDQDSDCDEEPEAGDTETGDGEDLEDDDLELDQEDGEDENIDPNNELNGDGTIDKKNQINNLDQQTEMGSGSGPLDNNGLSGTGDDDEGGDDDDDPTQSSNQLIVSNNISSKIITTTTIPATSTTTQGAKIEVVVHPTLPASFPILSTDNSNQINDDSVRPLDGQYLNNPSTTTNMPDDTYKITPIYPSSTERWDEGDDPSIRSRRPDEKDEDNLSTFKPMPLPKTLTTPMTVNVAKNQINEEQQQQQQQQQQVEEKEQKQQQQTTEITTNKVEQTITQTTTTRPPINKIPNRNLWSTNKPPQSGLFGTTMNPWSGRNIDQTTTHMPMTPQTTTMSPNFNIKTHPQTENQQMSAMENFPALILYGLIGTLAVTAFVMVIVAFGIWRKTVTRSRALIKKAHMINNGGMVGGMPHPGAGHGFGAMMVPSQSHGSHLMGNIHHQPGLLSTYAPDSKSMQLGGNVTNTIVNHNKTGMQISDHDKLIMQDEEEDDITHLQTQRPMMMPESENDQYPLRQVNKFGQDQNFSSSIQNNWMQDPDQDGGNINQYNKHHNQVNSNGGSTGTADEASGSTSTSSSGSSDSQGSKALIIGSGNQQQQQQQQNMMNQFNAQQPYHPIIKQYHNNPAKTHQPINNHNPMLQFTSQQPGNWSSESESSHQNSELTSDSQESQQELVPMNYNSNITSQIFNNRQHQQVYTGQQGNLDYPTRPMRPATAFHVPASRSYQDLEHEQQQQHQRQMMDMMIDPNANAPFYQGGNQFKTQYGTNVSGNPVFMQTRPMMNQQAPIGPNGFLQDVPISASRIAMNPLATLSRRYPGLGLNRNILSEETSSSLVTASPSLARTSSSSSSFAINHRRDMSVNFAGSPIIKPKPIMDASGRLVNDYTPNTNQVNGPFVHANVGPPVPDRKDRSEAWYV